MKRKSRELIPVDVAARVLFNADRTCCVCRTQGKPVQIHHLDEDPSNNGELNLAVLCFDCHTDTQLRGGFHRKLDSDQVVLYRDDWRRIVELRRAKFDTKVSNAGSNRASHLKSLTTRLEILKETQQFLLLVFEYQAIGNVELRDKNIELAINQDPSDESVIFLRLLQGKRELIPTEMIEREIKRMETSSDWSQLARLYSKLGDHKNAIINYCKTVIEDLEHGGVFTAAYYLKELSGSEMHADLFEIAYREFTDAGDLWWRIRALEELGWDEELKSVLLTHRAEIEESKRPYLLIKLYNATSESEKLHQVERDLAENTRMVRVGSSGATGQVRLTK
jgi:tetratricopeptide (TPR) repeat protein